MKHLKYLILSFSIVFVMLTSCEKELDFKGSEDVVEAIGMTVLASPDTTLEAVVAHTYPFTRINPQQYDVRKNPNAESAVSGLFKKTAVLDTAVVSYSVNGATPKPMYYNADSHTFRCDYQPKLGDVIEVFASDPSYPTASAKFTVPTTPSAYAEIVSGNKYQQYYTVDHIETGRVDGGQDTVADVRIRLKGIDASKYYRLVVRSMTETEVDGQTVWDTNECFHSSDLIFRDMRLLKPRHGWYSKFSNLFEGAAVNAEEYECVVTTRLRRGDVGKRIVEVELQTITEDLYHYLKSVMLYEVYAQMSLDEQTEAVQIFSNINGGYGIAGALVRSQKQTIAF